MAPKKNYIKIKRNYNTPRKMNNVRSPLINNNNNALSPSLGDPNALNYVLDKYPLEVSEYIQYILLIAHACYN